MITLSDKRSTPKAGDDARFDAFLKKQFTNLRAEIDSQMAKGSLKTGKRLEFPAPAQKPARGGSTLGFLDRWKYGVAAVVVVAVAVPSVMQLNRQKTDLSDAMSAPTATQNHRRIEAEKGRVRAGELVEKEGETGATSESKNQYYAKRKMKSAAEADKGSSREASLATGKVMKDAEKNALAFSDDEDLAAGKESPAAKHRATADARNIAQNQETGPKVISKAEEKKASRSAGAMPSSPAAPAPAAEVRIADATKAPAARSMTAAPTGKRDEKTRAETRSAETAVASAEESPAAKPRSLSTDDGQGRPSDAAAAASSPQTEGQERQKKKGASEDEKAEMEKLWREYEKDPQAFSKNKQRSSRLKTLLARHDTKSRAKRMKSK